MSYMTFIDNLQSDDKVLVYDTKGGLVTEATVTERDDDARILLGDFGGGVWFSDLGNGLSYARGNKLMPCDQDIYNTLFTSEKIFTSDELEALAGAHTV